MNDAVLAHGLESFSPVQRLSAGEGLPFDALPLVSSYADALAEACSGRLQRPRVSVALVRNITASVVGLAADNVEALVGVFEDYRDEEHVAPAALALALDLVERRRALQEAATGSTAEAVQVAEARGWGNVQDVIASLSAIEGQLVSLGMGALRHAPALAARFGEDADDGSYADAASDVQRRLDLIAEPVLAPFFAKVTKTTPAVSEASALLRDAHVFRQAREGRLAESVALTRRRNALFTGWQAAMDSLQKALRLTFADRPEVLARVEASYWWNVGRLGRRSAPEQVDEAEPADAPSDPLAPTPA
jgi:hypothetical protein